jgi:hypothetical protein
MADFATVAELEGFMGTSGLGARGTAMLGYASAAIRLFCRQDIEATAGRQEEFAGEWNRYAIRVTQVPITAVSAITIDAVAFTEFFGNYLAGYLWRNDGGPWNEGPILVTYDSGYAADSDEVAGVKTICLEVAARALTGPPETFGLEVAELRGMAPAIFLTDEEKAQLLAMFGAVTVG